MKGQFFYSLAFKICFEEARIISNVPFKDVSGTTAKSKMELVVTKANGFQPLTFVTKSSNLDFAVVLDIPLLFFITHYKLTKYDKRSSQFLNKQWQRCTKQEKNVFK